MQVPYEQGIRVGSIMEGWFIPPETTAYRFYFACDDYCRLEMNNETSGNSTYAPVLIDNLRYTNYRDWWETSGSYKKISQWMNLTKDEPYYMKAHHLDGSGSDHFAAAVEINSTALPGHHHSMKEIQYIKLEPAQQFDTTRITITDIDSGAFILVFKNPNDLKNTMSSSMNADCSANTMRSRIRAYHARNRYIRAEPSVNKTCYDVDGNVTTSSSACVKAVYYIKVKKLLNSDSASSISVVKSTTKANIVVDLPKDVQQSAKPLGGRVRIKCVNNAGAVAYTRDMDYWQGSNYMALIISYDCPGFQDVLELYDTTDYSYVQNGRSWLIRF